jgi:hypothetical protein
MAESFIPKPGTCNLFPNDKKIEDWHADYSGVLITPEDILPNTPYYVNISNRLTAQGREFKKFTLGKQAQPKTQEESAKGADVEDDLGDVPF